MKETDTDTNNCYVGQCDKRSIGHSQGRRGDLNQQWGSQRRPPGRTTQEPSPKEAQQFSGQKKTTLSRQGKTGLHRAEGRSSLWCSQHAQKDNTGREGKDDRRRVGGPLQELSSTVEGDISLLKSLQNTPIGRVHIRFMSCQITPEINWRQKKLSMKLPTSAEKCWGLRKIAARWEGRENRCRQHPRGNASRSWWQAAGGTQASSHVQEDPRVSCDNQISPPPATKLPLPGCEAICQCPTHGSFHFQMEPMNQQKWFLTYIRS